MALLTSSAESDKLVDMDAEDEASDTLAGKSSSDIPEWEPTIKQSRLVQPDDHSDASVEHVGNAKPRDGGLYVDGKV